MANSSVKEKAEAIFNQYHKNITPRVMYYIMATYDKEIVNEIITLINNQKTNN